MPLFLTVARVWWGISLLSQSLRAAPRVRRTRKYIRESVNARARFSSVRTRRRASESGAQPTPQNRARDTRPEHRFLLQFYGDGVPYADTVKYISPASREYRAREYTRYRPSVARQLYSPATKDLNFSR